MNLNAATYTTFLVAPLMGAALTFAAPAFSGQAQAQPRTLAVRGVDQRMAATTFKVDPAALRTRWLRVVASRGAYEVHKVRLQLSAGRFRDMVADSVRLSEGVALPVPVPEGEQIFGVVVSGRALSGATRLELLEGNGPAQASAGVAAVATTRAASQRTASPPPAAASLRATWRGLATHQTRLDEREYLFNIASLGVLPRAVRLRAHHAPMHVYLVKLQFADGTFRQLSLGAFLKEGGTTQVLPVPVDGGNLTTVRVTYSIPEQVKRAPRLELQVLSAPGDAAVRQPRRPRAAPPAPYLRTRATPTGRRVKTDKATFDFIVDRNSK